MTLADAASLPDDSFTYLSPAHNTTSWLDHVIASDPNSISNFSILYDKAIYDHFPVYFHIQVPTEISFTVNHDSSQINIQDFISWDKLSQIEIDNYSANVKFSLEDYCNESFLCPNSNCSSVEHKKALDEAYKFFVNCLKQHSNEYTISRRELKFKQLPGWNDECKTLHTIARQIFSCWMAEGKIRYGYLYERMKSSRADFKRALNSCKLNEEQIKKNKLSASFALKNKNEFWKDIKKLKSTPKTTIDKMDNASGQVSIINVFNKKFKNIFDDKSCQTVPHDLPLKLKQLQNRITDTRPSSPIHSHIVFDAINSINNNCLGFDGLHSNHFKTITKSISSFLSTLFSSFLNHGYLPKEMLFGEIRPIIKNRLGSLTDSNNYRPIMISTNMLKIFEYCILNDLENAIDLHSNQFGFRRHSSTTMAVSILKETIKSYTSLGSKVCTAFLDLSKAFDRVNHNVLMSKLIDCNANSKIIQTLSYMYDNQFVRVRFNDSTGDTWRLGNGVRQGGITSPLLFNLYINDALTKLNNLNIGCKIGIHRHNSQAYADDLTLLSPSPEALQILINKLSSMLTDLNLTLNAEKSVCLVFNASKRDRRRDLNFTVNGTQISVASTCRYLGVILSDSMTNKEDILRSESAFLKQFYCIYRKFNYANTSILLYLFNSHCMSLYASELWFDLKGSKTAFKSHAINYHKCIKKLMNLPWRERNHVACKDAGLPIFRHLINWKCISFAFNLLDSKSMCMARHKYYFILYSDMFKKLKIKFLSLYSIKNVFDNELDAIRSRISFVQSREETQGILS